MSIENAKQLIRNFNESLYNYEPELFTTQCQRTFNEECVFNYCHPFETNKGIDNFITKIINPLTVAFPDLERRTTILIAGESADGSIWVGCCGYYTGSFIQPWLDIPPTGHIASMRFHEFYQVRDGQIVDVQAVW